MVVLGTLGKVVGRDRTGTLSDSGLRVDEFSPYGECASGVTVRTFGGELVWGSPVEEGPF